MFTDSDQIYLSALDLALDLPHADLPIAEIKAVLNAPQFNSDRLLALIRTCPSLNQQFALTFQIFDPNSEKYKGSQFPPAAIDTTATNTELSNKYFVNDPQSLLAAVLQKIDQIKPQPK